MQRQALHILRQTQKKREKRIHAERNKRVRPIVRFTPSGFIPEYAGKELFELMILVGDDTETYEPEPVRRAEERFRQLEAEWDDYLFNEAEDYGPTDYDDEPDDEPEKMGHELQECERAAEEYENYDDGL